MSIYPTLTLPRHGHRLVPQLQPPYCLCLRFQRRSILTPLFQDSLDVYCSEECKNWVGPSFPLHTSKLFTMRPPFDDEGAIYRPVLAWDTHGPAGISAWASTIPQGPPIKGTEEETSSLSTFSSRASYRQPKLLRLQRAASPSVCMSTPTSTAPLQSKPVSTPHQQISALRSGSMESMSSMDGMSSWSSGAESPVATPNTAPARSITRYQLRRNWKSLQPIASFQSSFIEFLSP